MILSPANQERVSLSETSPRVLESSLLPEVAQPSRQEFDPPTEGCEQARFGSHCRERWWVGRREVLQASREVFSETIQNIVTSLFALKPRRWLHPQTDFYDSN